MSERILDLADKAYDEAGASELGIVNILDQFCLKFAELIIRECMKLNRDILCEDDPDYLDQVYKEHFGIEE